MSESLRVERSPKRVRVVFGGETVADSRHALLVWEKPYHPTYFFPIGDVRTDLLEAGDGGQGEAGGVRLHHLQVGDRKAEAAAYSYENGSATLRDHLAFVWHHMDHWFEEDEEVYVHPRDPYTRLDVLSSSRHIRVEIDGVTVADSRHPTLLFETGLPVRYYLPKPDVRLDLLAPSDRRSECPYKGTAQYWSVQIGDEIHTDVVWSYPFPTNEAVRIAGLMAFYDERVDVFVDGERQDRPRTPFSP